MKKRLSPYGGIIRIRFNGSDLSLSAPLSKRRQKYNFFGYVCILCTFAFSFL